MPSLKRAMITTTAVAALLVPTVAHAAPTSPDSYGEPSPTALSRQVLDAAREAAEQPRVLSGSADEVDQQLDRAAADLVADGAVAVTGRVESPKINWHGAAGVRELDGKAKTRPHDRFRVASITKPMVATLVMQEVERGTWTLNTEIDQVIDNPFPDGVTIRQLLSHRSGAPTGTDMAMYARMEDPTSIDEFIDVLGEHFADRELIDGAMATPWTFEPGSDFNYSNAGYVMLGLMLEEVTGLDIGDLLERRVFRPAGMHQTDFLEGSGTRGPFLNGAAYTGDQGDGWYSLKHFDPSLFSSAGAVASTTEDLNDFTRALLTGKLVDSSLVEEMITPLSDAPMEYGLGVYRLPDPCEPGEFLYGHDGGSYGTMSITLSSRDGARQVSVGATGRSLDPEEPVIYDPNELLVPMMLATCS